MRGRSLNDALDELIQDEAKEGAPAVDWPRVEARLFDKMQAGAQPRFEMRRAPRKMGIAALVGVAAAAAVIAVSVHSHTPVSLAHNVASSTAVQTEHGTIDGDRLEAGESVAAGSSELVVSHTERASWTLSAGSIAHIKRGGDHIVVVLERGSVLASVTPSPTPERFAVEAGNTRVTVHGTIFRVTRATEGVSVEVQRGTVGIRAIEGGTDEVSLTAPSSAHFREDGTIDERPRVSAPPPIAKGAADVKVTNKVGSAPAPGSSRRRPTAPSAEVRASVAPVIEAVRRCFTERTEERGDMHVSVQTILALQALPSGKISAAVFQPPLAPNVEQCVAQRLAGMRLPSSNQGVQFEQAIVLDR